MPQAKVTQRFEASAERVYEAWLDPAAIGRWMFGPALRDEEVLGIDLDPRVGGRFSFRVKRGDLEIDHVGEYLALERPRRLVFSWGVRQDDSAPSRVIVEIAPLEQGSEVTLLHELSPGWEDFVERSARAWSKMLGALASHLA